MALKNPSLSPFLIWLMAIGSLLVVSNIYYNQPLLADMMKEFHCSQKSIGMVPLVTVLGYGFGLLLVVPLGDMMEKKMTILISLSLAFFMLILVATAGNLPILLVSSFFLGLFSVVPQLLIPFAAHLAPPEERGKVVGTVMSGLLIGILLSRTLAGFLDIHFGWRMVYWIATLFILLVILGLWIWLPSYKPDFKGNYGKLLLSLWDLVKRYPSLRESALIGFMLFAALNLFWSTLVFIGKIPPYHFDAETVGLFGLVGAAGALGAPIFGKLADRKGSRSIILFGIGLELISFILLYFLGLHLIALVVFVLFMDLGQQSAHISNQTKVFSLNPEARSRLNTVYMFSAFMGGAFGSGLGSTALSLAGLPGLSITGFLLVLGGLGTWVFFIKKPQISSVAQ